MAITIKESLHLPSPRLFQRKEIPPLPHITHIAKLAELRQSRGSAARVSESWLLARWEDLSVRGTEGDGTGGGAAPALVSTQDRQAEQVSDSDQEQTARHVHSEESGLSRSQNVKPVKHRQD